MHKLSINIPERDHRLFKIFAAARSITLSDLVIRSVEDKISEGLKKPNEETEMAFRDSDNDIDLACYENVEDLILGLGREQ